MYSTLDVDVRPGSGLGIFEIGESLFTTLDRLRGLSTLFPQVEVKYDPNSSATTPIILHIRPHLDLLFSGKGQRLHTICVRKLRDPNPPVTLRYEGAIISSVDHVLRRVGVNRAFGPTYVGSDMRYPGLWFSFEHDKGASIDRPAAAADDKAQEVERVFISQQGTGGAQEDALEEVKECAAMSGELSRAVLKVHNGIVLHFYGNHAPRPLYIRLGETTAQDLSVDLGPPPRVHYKEDARMTIHSPSKDADGTDDGAAYFYNYFQHGLDFLICGTTHIVRKIIVHTNLPGSALFQRYKRCPWELEGLPEDDEDDTPPRKPFYERFETISHFLSPHEAPSLPMLLDRTDEVEDLALSNPSTRLYGYDGVILEVTESSQITSVVLF